MFEASRGLEKRTAPMFPLRPSSVDKGGGTMEGKPGRLEEREQRQNAEQQHEHVRG
jgi:hypothetical protein